MSKGNLIKVFYKDLIISGLIISLPFLFFLYDLFPESSTLVTPLFRFESTYFGDVNYFAWILSGKFLILGFISIWYVTCKHKWRNFILVPLVFETYRIFGILNDEMSFFVQESMIQTFIYSIPISGLLALILNLIYKNLRVSYKQEINDSIDHELLHEISQITSSDIRVYRKIKENYIELLKKKDQMNRTDVMVNLSQLLKQSKNILNEKV